MAMKSIILRTAPTKITTSSSAITDPNTVDTTISNLTAGTYYFAIATLDSEGSV